MNLEFMDSVRKQFAYYKLLGDRAMAQLADEDLFWQPDPESNSIAVIVKHLWGNMLSRWTDFLTTDGEKEWRDREAEFENDIRTRAELMQRWESGWQVFLNTLESLSDEDLSKTIYIRNQGHTVLEALNRQLAHYPYHIGQMVYVAKMRASQWASLSIPRGGSAQFNSEKFAQPKQKGHYTDEVIGKG